jgi:hypothetical protein
VSKRRSLEEQIGGKCVHFSGLMNDKCDAGVVYVSVEGEKLPYRRGLPCFRDSEGGKCEKQKFPTAEEVAKRVSDIRNGFDRMASARRVIVAHIEKTGDMHGQVVCPTCCKPLYYRKAKCNGHIHAQCETPDCTSWME